MTGNICSFSGSQKWKWGLFLQFVTAARLYPVLWEALVFVCLSVCSFMCLHDHVAAPAVAKRKVSACYHFFNSTDLLTWEQVCWEEAVVWSHVQKRMTLYSMISHHHDNILLPWYHDIKISYSHDSVIRHQLLLDKPGIYNYHIILSR